MDDRTAGPYLVWSGPESNIKNILKLLLDLYSQQHIYKLCAINFKLLYSQNSKITNNDIDKNDTVKIH